MDIPQAVIERALRDTARDRLMSARMTLKGYRVKVARRDASYTDNPRSPAAGLHCSSALLALADVARQVGASRLVPILERHARRIELSFTILHARDLERIRELKDHEMASWRDRLVAMKGSAR